jgi:hypothetical protein
MDYGIDKNVLLREPIDDQALQFAGPTGSRTVQLQPAAEAL